MNQLEGIAANLVPELWAKLDCERHAWAFRAYQHFIDKLSPEIRERINYKDYRAEAYVVVFGKTQVGKTTLLLELMGVSAASMARVASVLRGGRAQGKSATATTMEYRRSPDEKWGIRTDEIHIEWHLSDASINSALGKLRELMEAQQLQMTVPCVVFIPADCFDANIMQPIVRMLDLPGDTPSNSIEQEHVLDMARKYVPLADLILLVGRSDDLSFLRSNGLKLPGIEDWQSAPRRFRIITTYSFTPKSVRDLVRQHQGPVELEMFQQRLIAQIEKSIVICDEVKRGRYFFPMEFGQSWQDAQKNHAFLYEQVAPLVDALKNQLLADIAASTTPLARLRAAIDAHLVIAIVKKQRLTAIRALIRPINLKRNQIRCELKIAKNTIHRIEKSYIKLDDRLKDKTKEHLHSDFQKYVTSTVAMPKNGHLKNVKDFECAIMQYKSLLREHYEKICNNAPAIPSARWFLRGAKVDVDSRRVNEILDKAFIGLLSRLQGYILDRYWFLEDVTSDYQQDLRLLREGFDCAKSALTKMAIQKWLDVAERKLKLWHDVLNRKHVTKRMWEEIISDNNRSFNDESKELIYKLQEYVEFKEKISADLVESQRFTDLLDHEYSQELKKRKKAIQEDSQPVSAFLALLSAVQLSNVRAQVLLHSSSA